MSYAHVWGRGVWLLVCPDVLSYDWQMGSVPLVTQFNDHRNILSAALLTSVGALLFVVIRRIINSSVRNWRAPASAAAAGGAGAISLLMPASIITISR